MAEKWEEEENENSNGGVSRIDTLLVELSSCNIICYIDITSDWTDSLYLYES